MKKINIAYWIITILFAGFMIFSAIPDMMVVPSAVDLISTQLGYPHYIISFLGVAKIIGSIVILIPGLRYLKEWAYAGLVFDLLGATYSVIAIDTPFSQWVFMLPPIIFAFASYILYRKKVANAYHS